MVEVFLVFLIVLLNFWLIQKLQKIKPWFLGGQTGFQSLKCSELAMLKQ